jgi:hypothetical protein
MHPHLPVRVLFILIRTPPLLLEKGVLRLRLLLLRPLLHKLPNPLLLEKGVLVLLLPPLQKLLLRVAHAVPKSLAW